MSNLATLARRETVLEAPASLAIRDATRDDAPGLTQTVHLASEGFALAMWTEMAGPGGDPWALGRARARRDEGGFSWRNARIAERRGQFAGALIGYALDDEPEEIGADTPEVFRPLLELERQAPGTFYINVLAVSQAHRRCGVARALVEDATEHAGGRDLSLIVAEGNRDARAAYKATGFADVAGARAVGGFGWAPISGDWVLMRRPA